MFTLDNLTELIKGGYQKAINENKELFIAFYSYLFADPDPCATCDGHLAKYWKKLENYGITLLNQRQMKVDSKFKLRAEITSLQMDFGSSEWFNNETMTDEIALRYLEINPNRIANFETYPENWEELLHKDVEDKDVEDKDVEDKDVEDKDVEDKDVEDKSKKLKANKKN